jgi:hypothetical protein
MINKYVIFISRFIFICILSLLYLFHIKWDIITKCILYQFGLYTTVSEENKKKYDDFKNGEGGIILFTHCTFYDHFLLYHEFQDLPKGVAKRKHLFFPFNYLFENIGTILFDEKSGISELIKNYTNERKPGDPCIILAPAAGYSNNEDQNKLEEFKSGGFLPMKPVLPVLIKFDPYLNWKKGESLFENLWKVLTYPEKKWYKVKVLDPISPLENDTFETYKQRVKQIMENEMEKLDVQKENKSAIDNDYKGSPLLFITSHLFLIISLIGFFYFKKYRLSLLVLSFYITSFFYHLYGNYHYEYMDILVVRISVSILVWISLFHKIYLPVILVLISYLLYFYNSYFRKNNIDVDKDMSHILFVHIPNFIGLMILIYFCPY